MILNQLKPKQPGWQAQPNLQFTYLPIKHLTMKATKTNPAISKLVDRFEDELLNILLEDLRNLSVRNQFMHNNKKVALPTTRKAA